MLEGKWVDLLPLLVHVGRPVQSGRLVQALSNYGVVNQRLHQGLVAWGEEAEQD